MTETKTVETT